MGKGNSNKREEDTVKVLEHCLKVIDKMNERILADGELSENIAVELKPLT